MNCRRVMNLMSAYVDGELTGQEMLEIRRHLSECEECKEEYESILFTKHAVSRLRNVAPREDFAASILARLDEVEVPPYQRFLNTISGLVSSKVSPVAAALAAAGLALVVLSSGGVEYAVPEPEAALAANAFGDQVRNISFMPDVPNSPLSHSEPLVVVNDIPGYESQSVQLASLGH